MIPWWKPHFHVWEFVRRIYVYDDGIYRKFFDNEWKCVKCGRHTTRYFMSPPKRQVES